MRNSIAILRLLALISFLFLISGCGQSGSPGTGGSKVIRLGRCLDVKHPVHNGMERWAELVKEQSEGDIEIKIYPSGQLGQEKELIEQLQMGSLDIAKVSSAKLESFVPEMEPFRKAVEPIYEKYDKDETLGPLIEMVESVQAN